MASLGVNVFEFMLILKPGFWLPSNTASSQSEATSQSEAMLKNSCWITWILIKIILVIQAPGITRSQDPRSWVILEIGKRHHLNPWYLINRGICGKISEWNFKQHAMYFSIIIIHFIQHSNLFFSESKHHPLLQAQLKCPFATQRHCMVVLIGCFCWWFWNTWYKCHEFVPKECILQDLVRNSFYINMTSPNV